MNSKKRKGESVKGILLAGNIGKAVFISLLLLLATTFVASALLPCDHNVEVLDTCCNTGTTEGWFYNGTGWQPSDPEHPDYTPLFNLSVDGDEYWAYCTNYTVPLNKSDTFNASIYRAEPSCKNNSIAHILNNWTHSCTDCVNVSAGQSAIWYFTYINDTGFCSLGMPLYNHTATPGDPEWESNWIPDCAAHQEACDFINASINKSVPYNINIAPSFGNFPRGTPIALEATVGYCDGIDRENVTVRFNAGTCTFTESGTNVYEYKTSDGKLKATLICDASVNSVKVTAQVTDMKWFESVDPAGCSNPKEYQETLRIINITSDANFNFYTQKVPVLTPFGIVALIGLLSLVVVLSIHKSKGKG